MLPKIDPTEPVASDSAVTPASDATLFTVPESLGAPLLAGIPPAERPVENAEVVVSVEPQASSAEVVVSEPQASSAEVRAARAISTAARAAMDFATHMASKKSEIEQLLAAGLCFSSTEIQIAHEVASQFAGGLRDATRRLENEIDRFSPIFLRLLKEDYSEVFRLEAAIKSLSDIAGIINQHTLKLQSFVAANDITLRGLGELLGVGTRLVKSVGNLSEGFTAVKLMSASDEIAKDPQRLAQVLRGQMQTTVTNKDVSAIQRGFYSRVLIGATPAEGSEVLTAALSIVPQLEGKKKGCCGKADTLALVRELRDDFVGLMQTMLSVNVSESVINHDIREFLGLLSRFQGVIPAQVLLEADVPDPAAYRGLFGVWSRTEMSARGVVGMCARAPKDALLAVTAGNMRKEVTTLDAVMQCLAVFCRWLDDEQKWTAGAAAFKQQLEADRATLTHGTKGDAKAQELAGEALKAVGDTLANVATIKTRLQLFSENKGGVDGIDVLQASILGYQRAVGIFSDGVKCGADASSCGGLSLAIKNLHDCLVSTKDIVAQIYGEFPGQWAAVARERQESVRATDRLENGCGARVDIAPIFDKLIAQLKEQLGMLGKGSTISQARGQLPVVDSPVVSDIPIDVLVERTRDLLIAIQEGIEEKQAAARP